MLAVEIILMVIAYTLIIITVFLEVVCYKRNLETIETIAFTSSLLLLIIALTASSLFEVPGAADSTNPFTLVAMTLVGLTTPLNVLEERQHQVPAIWKKVLTLISATLFLFVIAGCFFSDILKNLQYIVTFFLGLSVVSSMLLIRTTEPQKRIVHRDKTERIFAVAFIVLVPLSLVVSYVLEEELVNLKIGFTIPLVFILLAGSKFIDDLHRLSLLNPKLEAKEQNLKNYLLSDREKEIATCLTQGKSYKQISEELYISMPTVKTHVSNIYKKMGVKSRSELTVLLMN